MNRIIHTLSLVGCALISVMFTGCYQDFEPDIKSSPLLCVNSNIIAGQRVTVHVTRTWRYSEGIPNEDIDIQIKDADVSISVNGTESYPLKFEEREKGLSREKEYVYVSDYVAKEGDRITVSAISKDYGEAHGSTIVPNAIKIDKVVPTIKNRSIKRYGNRLEARFDLSCAVTFTDPGDAINYYRFDIDRYLPDGYLDENNLYHGSNETITSMTYDFSEEPIFSEHVGVLEAIVSDTGGYTVFSDRQISGKSYTIHFSIPGCHYECNDITRPRVSDLVVKLSHISTGYYNYMMSLWATTEGINGVLGDVGLGNPVWEYSNVSTGAGIISSSAVYEYHIPYRSLAGE